MHTKTESTINILQHFFPQISTNDIIVQVKFQYIAIQNIFSYIFQPLQNQIISKCDNQNKVLNKVYL